MFSVSPGIALFRVQLFWLSCFGGSLRHSRMPLRTPFLFRVLSQHRAMIGVAASILVVSFGYVLYAPIVSSLIARSGSAERAPYTGGARQGSALAGGVGAVSPPQLEMHVANNGLVLLRGAVVTEVSGTTLTLDGSWGKAHFVWEVQTDSQTKFFHTNGTIGELNDIHPGDIVMATGNIDTSASLPTLHALYLRE